MKSSLDNRRRVLTARVLHDLAVHHKELPIASPDGSRPIVVAVDDELLSTVARRIKNSGGSANLFIGMTQDEIVLLSVSDSASNSEKAEVFSKEPMHENVTIGMLATYVSKAPEGVLVTVKLPKLDADLLYVERRELIGA
ncbi:MAG: hypothetical protein KF867_02330 [Cryobacterium sp.]|nr:hypothetical protein [Cryobacterium sp.]